MKMSGTKPMKNTMRKPSPAKMMKASNPAGKANTKVSAAKEAAMGAIKKKLAAKKEAATSKPVEGKPNAKPAATKGVFGAALSKATEMASKATPMKMKKSGMGKKC